MLFISFIIFIVCFKRVDGEYSQTDRSTKPVRRESVLDNIHFRLYPFKSHPSIHQTLAMDPSSIQASNFISNATKTVIIIHGFWPNLTRFSPLEIKRAYLNNQHDNQSMNIIYLDWSVLSTPKSSSILTSYPIIVFRYIPLVAWKLTNFLHLLKTMDYVKPNKIHLIGYSLGAHVAGLTGQLFQRLNNNGSKIGRITGLDPALPLFRNMFRYEWFTWRLSRRDADFVDVYHTAMRMTGIKQRGRQPGDGHADFYVNGGNSPQPGCLLMDMTIPIICSHLFAVKLFIESIPHKFMACQCETMIDFFALGVACLGGCRKIGVAGEGCKESTRGQYYVKTGWLMAGVGIQ